MLKVPVTDDHYTVEPLYQWDVNQTLEIYGLSLARAPEIHFAYDTMPEAIVRQSTMDAAGVIRVDIPNGLLQKPYKINVYICDNGNGTFQSLYKIVLRVEPRAQPSDYEFTEEDGLVYSVNALMVNAVTLEEGAAATVRKETGDGAVRLTFGIPRGQTGPIGPVGPRGPQGLAGNSGNWLVGDPTQPGFIQGRTHYKEFLGEDRELIPETEVVFSRVASVSVDCNPEAPSISAGQTYIVTWDGVEYECVCMVESAAGQTCIGNASFFSSRNNNTGEPFLIRRNGDSRACIVYKQTNDDETISIKVVEKQQVVLHQLGEEYLPNGNCFASTEDGGTALILYSPNGTRYALTVDDAGNFYMSAVIE